MAWWVWGMLGLIVLYALACTWLAWSCARAMDLLDDDSETERSSTLACSTLASVLCAGLRARRQQSTGRGD